MATALQEIYTTYQSVPGGDSGRGNSHYTKAAECGRLKRLMDADKAEGIARVDPIGKRDGLKYFEVGRLYHLLQEHGAQADLSGVWDLRDEAYNPEFLEALRLYRGWCSLWGSITNKYGEVVATELSLPTPGAATAAAQLALGGEFTGRIDLLVRISDADAVMARTGLILPGPGLYIIDHKTAAGPNKTDAHKFTNHTQAMGYATLYNLEHPDDPVVGTIFDMLYKHKVFLRVPKIGAAGKVVQGKSHEHFYQATAPDDQGVIVNLVQLGSHNYDNDIPNPTKCHGPFGTCEYLTSGRCNRTRKG
jgi:hypothetical protein